MVPLSLRREQFSKFKSFLGARVWRLFLYALLAGLLWFLIEFSFIYVMQGFFFAIGLISDQQLFLPKWYPQGLGFAVGILILFGVLRSTVLLAKTVMAGLISQTFVKEQREKILRLALLGDSPLSTPDVIAHFSDRTVQAASFIQSLSTFILVTLTATLLTIGGLLLLPLEFTVGILIFSVFVLPLNRLNKKITQTAQGIHDEWRKVTQTLLFGIRNSFLLKIYNRRQVETRKGSEFLARYLAHFLVYYRILALKGVFPNIVGIIGISLVTVFSVFQLHTPAMKLVSLYYIFIRLAQNVSEMGTYYADLKMYLPNFKSLYNFLQRPLPEGKPEAVRASSRLSNVPRLKLELRDVTFAYPGRPPVLKNFNLQIETGQILLVKGESGAGKSTLLSLMTGVLLAQSGRVSCNDLDVRDSAHDLAEVIGYVGPDSYLLPGSVKENLQYPEAHLSLPDSEYWDVLEKSLAKEIVEALPGQLNEPLNEDAQLSTGQKQRLGFARALLRRPKILILDEATSNLDVETEQKIMNLLRQKKAELIIVIVSHRSTFDAFADVTLKMIPGQAL